MDLPEFEEMVESGKEMGAMSECLRSLQNNTQNKNNKMEKTNPCPVLIQHQALKLVSISDFTC